MMGGVPTREIVGSVSPGAGPVLAVKGCLLGLVVGLGLGVWWTTNSAQVRFVECVKGALGRALALRCRRARRRTEL